MNCAKARCNLAIGPLRTTKREPLILAATSKSKPSGPPRSTWSLISKSKMGSSPQRFTSLFSVSSLPVGTDSSGRLGMPIKKSAISACSVLNLAAPDSISVLTCATSVISAEASSPLPFFMPMALDNWLRLACNSSVRVCKDLRSVSKALNFSTSRWNLRVAKRAATAAISLRSNCGSIMWCSVD